MAMPHPTDGRLALELDALGPQVGDGGVDVVARQGQLVVGRLGGVDADLARREGEDEPPVAGVDVVPAEDVARGRPAPPRPRACRAGGGHR